METSNEPISSEITLDLLLGNVNPVHHPLFVEISVDVSDRSERYMHKEAYPAFLKMHKAAATDGIPLVIVSAMRTFTEQKRIWNNKWTVKMELADKINAANILDPPKRALEILKYSAMPGTSRHHWGTDIDINSVEPAYFATDKGKREYRWLCENAAKFGFCQPYTPHGQNRWGGYEEEPWHWSYVPIAANYLIAFQKMVSYQHIRDFDGWETAEELKIIRNFVVNINSNCLIASQ